MHSFSFNFTFFYIDLMQLFSQKRPSNLSYLNKIKWYQRWKWNIKRLTELSTE